MQRAYPNEKSMLKCKRNTQIKILYIPKCKEHAQMQRAYPNEKSMLKCKEHTQMKRACSIAKGIPKCKDHTRMKKAYSNDNNTCSNLAKASLCNFDTNLPPYIFTNLLPLFKALYAVCYAPMHGREETCLLGVYSGTLL